MIKEAIATAATRDEAIQKAKSALNAPLDADVKFDIIQDAQKGFLGIFGGKEAKVRAYYEAADDSGIRVLVDAKVDYGQSRNQAMTAIVFVTGLSGISIQIGSIQLTGMVLACVVGMLMGLMFFVLDKLNLTNDRE